MVTSIHYAYCFEAKSVQKFLFAGSKLRHLISASELLERLTGEILEAVIQHAGLLLVSAEEYPDSASVQPLSCVFARRSAGAFYLVSPSQANLITLRSLWQLFFEDYVTGLDWQDIISDAPANNPYNAVKTALDSMKSIGVMPKSSLPVAAPLALLCPRTAMPALGLFKGVAEYLDESLHNKELLRLDNQKSFFDRLLPTITTDSPPSWPVDLEKDFPRNQDSYVAIIHIDGNGLGQLLINLQNAVQHDEKEYLSLYPIFSQGLKEATENAVKKAIATLKVANQIYAARPIVVGGDDITFLVHAPEAIAFTRTFIESFEAQTQRLIADLCGSRPELRCALPAGLSACAGIAFCKLSAPFTLIYKRAEELCNLAKQAVKTQAQAHHTDIASAIAFEVLTSAPLNAYQQNAMTKYQDANGNYLSLEVYHVGTFAAPQLPSLTRLCQLAQIIREQQLASKLRQYLEKRQSSKHLAEAFLERLNFKFGRKLEPINTILKSLFDEKQGAVIAPSEGWLSIKVEQRCYSPLCDVLEVIDMDCDHSHLEPNS